jgi:hypothetical protein
MDHPNKNQPKNDMMNKKLIQLIQANEDWLMEKILHYAIEREYSKYLNIKRSLAIIHFWFIPIICVRA